MHLEAGTDHATAHHHNHTDTQTHHQEGSDESSSEEDHHTFPNLASPLTHTDLGANHFSDFTGTTSYSFVPSVILAVLLFLGNRWPRLSQHRLVKPPDDSPDQRLQLFCLSAASRRGPPYCS